LSNADSSGGTALGGAPASSSGSRRGRWAFTFLLLALLAAGGGVVLAVGDHGDRSDAAPAGSPGAPVGPHGVWNGLEAKAAGRPPAAELAAERRSFALFRGEDEPVPARMSAHIRETIGAPPGAFAFEETQLADSSQGRVWAVSGEGVACLVEAKRGSLACDPAPAFLEDGLVLGVVGPPGSANPHDFTVFGIAPDWARRARLRVGRSVRQLAIHGNVYALRATEPILLLGLER
jgi:hypothetical protein